MAKDKQSKKMKALCPFKTSENTNPATQSHVQDLNPQDQTYFIL